MDDRNSVGFDKELNREYGVNRGILLRRNIDRHLLEADASVRIWLDPDGEFCRITWKGEESVHWVKARA